MTLKPNTFYYTKFPYVEGVSVMVELPPDGAGYTNDHVWCRTDDRGEIIKFKQKGEIFTAP